MEPFLKHLLKWNNVIRALRIALPVGTILGLINHYDMFFTGRFAARRIVQILITYVVPFCVSLFSSALTGRHHERLKPV